MNALWHQSRRGKVVVLAIVAIRCKPHSEIAVWMQQLCTRLTQDLDFELEDACPDALRGGSLRGR
jgi:hypothetical protein